MRRLMLGAAAVTVAAGSVLVVPAMAATGPYCGQTWGSTDKQATGSAASLAALRAGQQDCYDRLVLDIDGPAAGYDVRYVSQVVTQGQGAPQSLRGAGFLDVTVKATTYDTAGRPTFTPSSRTDVVDVTGYRTFRQVAFGGSFEGYTTFGLGVRARLPFRVFVLRGPGSRSRLVVDVGHQW